MSRWTCSTAMVALLLISGCSDPGDSTGTGGAGGTEPVDPGPTCIALCMKAVGECEAFVGSEEDCRQGCQRSLDDEYAHAQACGEAAEGVFLCAIELEDCQEIYDWRDQQPPDGFPCQSAVLVYDRLVEGGTCLLE